MTVKNRKAFTFVEVLVTVLIFTVMLEGVYIAFQIGTRSWQDYSKNLIFKQEIRRGLIAMTMELREADNLFVTEDKDGVTATFNRPGIGEVTYSWYKTGANANKIIRTHYEKTRTLASNIKQFTLNMPTNHEVFLEIQAGQDNPFRLKEKIAIRTKTPLFRAAVKDLI